MPDYRVEGKNILDPGFGGSNVRNMESGRFDKEQSQKLVKNIKAALDPETKKTNEALRKIAESIGKNTIAFQEAAQNWTNSDRKNAKSYINAVAQNKKGFKARLQRESLAAAAPDGIDTSNDLKNTGIIAIPDRIKSIREKGVFNSVKEGLFGTKDPNDPQAKAKGGFFQNQFGAGAAGSSGFLGLGSTAEGKRAAAARRAGVDTLKGQGPSPESLVMEATDVLSGNAKPVSVNEVKAKKDKEKIAEKGTQKVSNSGVDKETPAERQSELLEEIRDELKKLNASAEGGMFGGGGGGGFDLPGFDLPDNRRPGPSKGLAKWGSRLKFLGRNSPLIAAAGLAVKSGYDAYNNYNEADQLVESGAVNEETGQMFTEQDETAGKVEAVSEGIGGAAGGVGGAYAGMALGATIGSVIPGVGTVIGGAVGGLIGAFAGNYLGEKAGRGIGDAATTTSGEAALDAAKESGLYNKNWIGPSEVNLEILKETTDTEQLYAILSDDDISEEQKLAVTEQLDKIENNQISEGETNNTSTSIESTTENNTTAEAVPPITSGSTNRPRSPLYEEFGNSPAGPAINIPTPRERSERARELAEQMGIPTGSLQYSGGAVITSINGMPVPEELYTEEEKTILGIQETASDMIESSRQAGSIEEMQGGPELSSIERSVLPTGDAVDNMTEAASTQQIASAAPVVNNITNNTTNPTSKPIVTNPVTPRSINSSLERLQNQRSVFLMG